LQWGEVAGNIRSRFGATDQLRILSTVLPSEVEIVPVTGERAVRAAELKVDRKIAYADAIALELARESSDHVLVTADYGYKAVDDMAHIEFLPSK
jgi:predicted nucleic acid-binding protein